MRLGVKCFKEIKVKNWAYLVKDRRVWYELMQKNKTQEEEEKERRR